MVGDHLLRSGLYLDPILVPVDPAHGLTLQQRLLVLIVLGAVILGVVLAFTEPSSGLWPRCMIKSLTGLDCPGCGSQRAFHALIHGDIVAAWGYNALIFILAPVPLLLIASAIWPQKLAPVTRALNSRTAALTLLAVIVLWTIVRNLL